MKSFLKKIFQLDKSADYTAQKNVVVDQFLKEFGNDALDYKEGYSVKLSNLPKYTELKKKPEHFKKEVILALISDKKGWTSHGGPWGNNSYYIRDVWTKALSQLLRSSDINLNSQEILDISKRIVSKEKGGFYSWQWPINPLITLIQKKIELEGNKDALTQSLNVIGKAVRSRHYVYSEDQKILDKIARINEKPSEFKIRKNDPLGQSYLASVQSSSPKERECLKKILEHFAKGFEKSAPSNTWLKTSEKLINEIGKEKAVQNYLSWIATIITLFKQIHRKKAYDFDFVFDENLQILRSAVWTAPTFNHKELNESIEELGLWSFKKLPQHGALSVKLGNACIYTFSKLPYQDGISRLTKFRMKIKYPSVRKTIEKAINGVATAEGKTMDEIEELAVQEFGLNGRFQVVASFGDYKGLATVENSSSISLVWENEKGKQVKSVPKYVKEGFPEELKEYKRKIKDIQTNLSAQKSRIEKIFLGKREWTFQQWSALYLENNLLAFFGTKLIWNFKSEDKTVTAVFHNGRFVDCNEKEYKDFKGFIVTLWHPVHAKVEEVQSWRTWLEKNKIRQPFKQAHREIYVVTDAEHETNSYSNRFAAHILRQHVFIALCRERGWAYQLQGQWDSHNTPTLIISAWKYRVEYWVEGVENEANEMGIFNYLHTDQVRFYDAESQVNMSDVPPIVFSEAMRDVDLFVGVTSIGADPNWRDGGTERFHGYWSDFSFGELATSGVERKKILQNIVPRLKIADQCTFEGNFLVVKGAIRIYKIHLGSGNILMKPNDQYLCIVPSRSKEKNEVFLPFEGDRTLSIILSKAFLLAEDKKIKDRTIISQINS